jgi:hypothetical protein
MGSLSERALLLRACGGWQRLANACAHLFGILIELVLRV